MTELLRTTVADEIEATEMSKRFVMDQWSSNVKDMVTSLNLTESTDANQMQRHMLLVRTPVNCCADTDEVVNKHCFLHRVWGEEQQDNL